MNKAFTLIELLVVVTVIAILAAIAIPNFLEAQTRSKVARVKADLRTISQAIDAYTMDNNAHPCNTNLAASVPYGPMDQWVEFLNCLSTPVAYLTSIGMRDPFHPDPKIFGAAPPANWRGGYFWIDYDWKNQNRSWGPTADIDNRRINEAESIPDVNAYLIYSFGPDRTPNWIEYAIFIDTNNDRHLEVGASLGQFYDPTNGTLSVGDIGRWGGASPLQTTN